MGFIKTIFGFVLAAFLVAFAVSNRQDTTLIYSPVHDPLNVPLYLLALLFMATGFVLGGTVVWLNGSKTRRLKRQQRKTIKELEKELEKIETTDPKIVQPASEFFPALPKITNNKGENKNTALLGNKN